MKRIQKNSIVLIVAALALGLTACATREYEYHETTPVYHETTPTYVAPIEPTLVVPSQPSSTIEVYP